MTVETHDVVFSFDQPGDLRNPLLSILQQLLHRPLAKDARASSLVGSQKVLIIDAQQERAQYVAHLIASAGYRPFVAPTPLDAYTLFLQGTFHPFAIVLSEESAANQFFLSRLSQQFLQRYDWKVPFIRLRIQSSEPFAPRSTEPLGHPQGTPRPRPLRIQPLHDGEQQTITPPPSAPLSLPGESGQRFHSISLPLNPAEEASQPAAQGPTFPVHLPTEPNIQRIVPQSPLSLSGSGSPSGSLGPKSSPLSHPGGGAPSQPPASLNQPSGALRQPSFSSGQLSQPGLPVQGNPSLPINQPSGPLSHQSAAQGQISPSLSHPSFQSGQHPLPLSTQHSPAQSRSRSLSGDLQGKTQQPANYRPSPPSQPLTRLRSNSTPLQPPSSMAGPASFVPETFPGGSGGLLGGPPAIPPQRQMLRLPAPGSAATSTSGGVPQVQHTQAEKISLDGLSIGRYQLKSILGGSPIGDVYLTYDRLREQDIVLKTIQTNMVPGHLMDNEEEDYNLFQPEWELLQQIEHPHISRVMNIGKSYISGFPFVYKTMPYYAEGSLARWINQFPNKLFPPSEVARLISQLADALQFLHSRGVLYQNFKLTNIMLVNESRNLRDLHVVLSDLPFVRDIINLPKAAESYRYFAPEQWEGDPLPSSDQYGLAVIAYELLAGRAPFQGNSDAIMRRMHLTMPAPAPSSFNSKIYPFVDKALLRALAKRPEERFESIQAFATALERASN